MTLWDSPGSLSKCRNQKFVGNVCDSSQGRFWLMARIGDVCGPENSWISWRFMLAANYAIASKHVQSSQYQHLNLLFIGSHGSEVSHVYFAKIIIFLFKAIFKFFFVWETEFPDTKKSVNISTNFLSNHKMIFNILY